MTMKPNPFRDTEGTPTHLGRLLLGDIGMEGSAGESSFGNWDPPLDIEETDKEYTVTMDLPAVKKEDIKVQLEGGVLTMEGERRLTKEERGKKYHRVERPYGFFLRRFTVPSIVDAAALRAEYTNGVLKVRLPKSTVSKPTAVDVKVA